MFSSLQKSTTDNRQLLTIFTSFTRKRITTSMRTFFFLVLLLSLGACGNAPTNSETPTAKAQTTAASETPEDRLKKLGIELPKASTPVANYVNSVQTGKLVFLAGKGPKKPDGEYITGKLGQDLEIEQGYEAARLVAINQLAVLKADLGDLSRVKRVVKVLGMVNAAPDFTSHPEVINGFSDLMVEVFGEKGKHARAAVGMGSLPRNIAVEIEAIIEIE